MFPQLAVMQILLHAVAIHILVALQAAMCLCHLSRHHGASVIVHFHFTFSSINYLSGAGLAQLVY